MRASLAFSLLSLLALTPTSLCSPAPVANPEALAEAEAFANPEPVELLEAREPDATCPTIGAACGTNGNHKCNCNQNAILVCKGGKWELAAKCGNQKCQGSGNGPHCG